MSRRPHLFGALALGAVALCLVAGACGSNDPADPTTNDIEQIQLATAIYSDVDQALSDGFVPLSECIAGPDGAMGFHYGMPGRLEDSIIDPAAPEVLLFEPTLSGGKRLVGVEFMMHQDAWAGAGNTSAPTLAGETFEAPNPNHPDPMVRPFYTLHVWVWQDNPSGMFAPFNPTVNCS